MMGVEGFQEAVRKRKRFFREWGTTWYQRQGLESEYGGVLIADTLRCHVQTLELGHE